MRPLFFIVVLLLLFFKLPVTYANQERLQEAELLIKSGDYRSAYLILEPIEDVYAGNQQYDYLFGVAAIETGHVTRGMFALERILANNPDNVDARAEFAIGHYKLGESDEAKQEFQHIIALNPPEAAKATIERFMSAIDRQTGNVTTFSAFLEGTIGYDSNIVSATNATSIAIPLFGGQLFELNRAFTERGSSFGSFAGGIQANIPLNDRLSLIAGANGSTKINNNTTDFDIGTLDYSVGARYKHYEQAFTLMAQDGYTEVGGERFRRAYGLTAQWQYDINESNQISAFVQKTRLKYDQGQSIRDADRSVGGLSYAHVFTGDLTPVMYASIYGGLEDEKANDVPFLGHDLYGVRVGGQISVLPKLVLFANTAYENRKYGGSDPIFLVSREDHQYDVSFGARFLPGHNWVIKPQVSYIDTKSNIALNAFDRLIASISFRHDLNW